jgi:hypothetical protein
MEPRNRKLVTAVFRDRVDWETVYEWLRDRGYNPNEINVLMSENTRNAYLTTHTEGEAREGTKVAAGMAAGGAVGTVTGAAIAAVLAIGTTLFVPPLGLFIAGPIAAAFAGAGAGAVAGGVLGGMLGLGISEPNAKIYQEALRDGGVVVGVAPHSTEDGNDIENCFKTNHGENIAWC